MRLSEFLYMQKTDRQVLLSLLVVATAVLGIVYFSGETPLPDGGEAALPADSMDTAAVPPRQTARPYEPYRQEERKPERFAFDPNTADSTLLLRLGLRPWQVRNIYKYRAAGGIYRTKEDFARLYGLTAKEYRELEPYIRISPDYQPASALLHKTRADGRDSMHRQRYPQKLSEGETVDLATADTAALRRVPGVGSYFARRIVEYGERLGGYVSVDQLDEIKGFPQTAKAYIAIKENAEPRKLQVNALSADELQRHPYLNYYQARAIADYRRLHGPLRSLDDLRLLRDFPPETIERLRPYVAF